MSTHHKPHEQALYDYDGTNRPNEDGAFQFTQPTHSAAHLSVARGQQPHGSTIPASTPYHAPFLSYAPRDVPSAGSTYTARSLDPLPVITSHSPLTGTHGSSFRVSIKASYELSPPPTVYTLIMFGQIRRSAMVKREQPDAHFHHYTLETEIPTFDPSQSPETQVPLYVQFEDDYGNSLGTVEVGDFSYYSPVYSHEEAASLSSRKRKQSLEHMDYLESPSKRSVSQQLMERMRGPPAGYQAPVPQRSSAYLRSDPSAPYAVQQQVPLHQSYSRASAVESSAQYAIASYNTPRHVQSPNPGPPSYGQGSRGSVSSVPSVPPSMTIGHPSSSSSAPPTLVRTSSMTPSSAPHSTPGSAPRAFNPYAMYPNSKAVLKIDGDLDKMAEDWDSDEWSARRRLVQFQRSQSGSTINAIFKPVSLEDRTPGSICVSCIWWAERNEYFVTSVDTIYLLEALVAVKFTVEEKNRIRRNLEGFRPLTVSKAKDDSEEFFKVIMGFPNPKPRNIEKDVKVFPWKILAHALKKIIGKYSASYASTASALPPPSTSGYASATQTGSESSREQQALASPVSASSSATSNYRGSGMTTTARSPGAVRPAVRTGPTDNRGSAGLPHSVQMRPQDYLGMEMSPALPTSVMPVGWISQLQMQSYAAIGAGRQPLDMSVYMPDSNPAMSATPGSAQNLHQYYRSYPGSMPSPGQDPNRNVGGHPYDLYSSQAGAPGANQQTSRS